MVLKCFSPELARSVGLAVNRFPETSDEVALAESVLARELAKLSLDEHEKILFDVHGIPRTSYEEEPDTLKTLLDQLETELQNVTYSDRQSYDLAKSINPSYVNDPKFRLMFLRAVSYDPKAAAETIIIHFVVKQRLFGCGEILARDVKLSDLEQQDVQLLESGFTQVLPSRDAAGRTVVAMSPEFRTYGTKKALMEPLVRATHSKGYRRVLLLFGYFLTLRSQWILLAVSNFFFLQSRATWYFNMALMKDEETQRKGSVLVIYNFCGYHEPANLDSTKHHVRLAMPQRVHAIHFCAFDNPKLRSCVTGIQLFIDSPSRFRLRPHFGTAEEVEFELQTFGIPTHDSPMQKDTTWSNEWHQEWLALQRSREEPLLPLPPLPTKVVSAASPPGADSSASAPSGSKNDIIIDVPLKFDVLHGKSKKERMHTGNLRAMHLCDMYWENYEEANKFGKTEVAERIVAIVQESGGRFLRARRKGGWEEVDDCTAREKISHFFRFMRSKSKNSNSNSSQSSEEFQVTSSSPTSVDSEELTAKNGKSAGAKRVTPCASPDLTLRQPRQGVDLLV